MAKPPYRSSRKNNGPRINHNIVSDEIRVVGAEGEMLGVMSVGKGIAVAEEAGLDLVEVSPTAKPPVCKVLDFGKYKYEQQKKASEARKKQKTVDVKEIKMRPNIEEHDYAVKLRNANRFIKAENKVKVTLRFRGREMAHKDIAARLLQRFCDDLADVAKVDLAAKMDGRQMIMVLSPDLIAAEALKKAEKLEAKKLAKEEKMAAEAKDEPTAKIPKEEAGEDSADQA